MCDSFRPAGAGPAGRERVSKSDAKPVAAIRRGNVPAFWREIGHGAVFRRQGCQMGTRSIQPVPHAPPSRLTRLVAAAALALQFASMSVGVAFFAGVLVEDRFVLTQWLSWIPAPAPALLAVVALGLTLGARVGAWRLQAAAQVLLVAGAVGVMMRSTCAVPRAMPAPADAQVRLLQWNTNWPAGDDPRSMEALASATADVVLLSNRGSITSPDMVARWAGQGARVVGAGPFALVTEWPVTEATMVAAGGSWPVIWYVARFTVLPPAWQGRPLRIAMVDLPSRPSLSRMAIAQAMLDGIGRGGLGAVDVVAGDFNAIGGSVILSRCFPGMRDAAREAGSGWYATWPRRFPLWQIDHTLLGAGLRCERAWTEDPGISSHRMTMSILTPSAGGGG